MIFKERSGGMTYALYANDRCTPGRSGQIYDTAEREAGGPTQLTPNVWTHLATTYDGNSLRLYVNAVQVSSVNVPSSIVSSTGPAQDRRQRHLGRVLHRSDRRTPHLQPPARPAPSSRPT